MGTEYTPADPSTGEPESNYGDTYSESEVTEDASGMGYTSTSDYVSGENALTPIDDSESDYESEEEDYGDGDDD
ncbi:predicted protein [Streptomyces viridochromogenes DSM 40736]|uniref:Predicted protein n=1 Tax=Streptomyces viridochromogenes (strain DSM 40736 / JCM 4977 / BCRC 1201 / Tue 494) TaxID=591159 RepID=D9X2G6_STRVT|nr:hypothetical protein [Streptomyces viridochromogenes]EFL33635.1 predicted protein [Streptomyces viridochromogenes DSM 40736]